MIIPEDEITEAMEMDSHKEKSHLNASWETTGLRIWAYLIILTLLILLTMALPNARPQSEYLLNKDMPSEKAFLKVTKEISKPKIIDKTFIAISSYLVLMTVFDIETTFSAIHNGAHEANPIMKPFAKNRAYMYGVQLGIDALAIWLAYEMKGSKHKEFNQTWWILPSIIGTSHGVCGSLNLRYVW